MIYLKLSPPSSTHESDLSTIGRQSSPSTVGLSNHRGLDASRSLWSNLGSQDPSISPFDLVLPIFVYNPLLFQVFCFVSHRPLTFLRETRKFVPRPSQHTSGAKHGSCSPSLTPPCQKLALLNPPAAARSSQPACQQLAFWTRWFAWTGMWNAWSCRNKIFGPGPWRRD